MCDYVTSLVFFQRFHTECARFEGPLADSAVEVVPELVKCDVRCRQNTTYVPDTSDRRTRR